MPVKKKRSNIVPWQLALEDEKYQKEPWILKKGKSLISIQKNKFDRGSFYIQKDDDKRLSLDEPQARMTYKQLIEFGYKLQSSVRARKKTTTE